MKKKAYLTCLVLVVAVGAIVAIVISHRSANAGPMTVAQAKARAPTTPPSCVSANKQLELDGPAGATYKLELAITSQLTDVPAGTQVDIRYATYGQPTVTGSAIYPKNYGTYNFTAQKDASPSNQLGWKVTSFIPCKS